MQIGADSIVTFHYTLKDESGVELENNRNEEPQACLMGRRNILVGLEEAMQGKSVGDTLQVTLPPAKAYGKRQENAQHRVPIKHLIKAPKKILVGQIVHLNTKEGTRNARVIKVGRFNIDVDSNHPFAGQTLSFDIDIVDVRLASRDELAHGHAHGAGGHHH
ncbi:MAG: FKBP-type peptidyl-prolyl cis-trans isomerase SlyD [Candidatus Pseudothioglobus sp.]|jgi:FKBP-type peptidyl-prolyl cis-trans isomerase SlyD